MNRQLIIAGLVAFGLMLFVFIFITTAAPSLQTADSEPNNTFDDANPMSLSGGSASATGELEYQTPGDVYTDVIDYYVAMPAELGRQYRASLNPYGSVGGLTLKINLYDASRDFLDDDNDVIQWTAYTTTYYVSVQALVATTTTLQSSEYILNINRLGTTPTPTPSNTPTNTPVPTDTPYPTSVSTADQYEEHGSFTDNNEAARAFVLPATTYLKLSDYLGKATFHTLDPNRDEDWYKLWAKEDKWYEITTSELSGVDTRIVILDKNVHGVTRNDDGGGGYASEVLFEAEYDGYYYIRVHNKVNATGSYNMTIEESDDPTPEPTVTPGPGADTKADSCEDNLDFAHACIIAPNSPKKFNFVPPYGSVDNDFFKLWVKPGYNYECSTTDLDAGIDPNMIVFNGPSWDNAVGGNDDVEPGDFNSYFSYYATYEGWLYVLVGYGDRTPSDIYNSNYTLKCNADVPGEPTATPAPTGVPGATGTPRATAARPTVTPFAGLSIRPLTTPTPKPEAPSESVVLPISLLIYYDANGDGQPGAGEGVGGIAAQAFDVSTNSSLAQGITDAQGYLEFTVTAQGPVRVSVPFFGFSRLVTQESTIRLRVLSSTRP
jgi:hypothetical protein